MTRIRLESDHDSDNDNFRYVYVNDCYRGMLEREDIGFTFDKLQGSKFDVIPFPQVETWAEARALLREHFEQEEGKPNHA